MKIKKILIGAVAIAAAFLFAEPIVNYFSPSTVEIKAAERETGADWSKYQGPTAIKGKASDTFGMSQIGGYYGWTRRDQATYSSQVSTGIAQSLRVHSYIYLETGSNQAQTKAALDYYLPKIQTPKKSILAIDYESGASGDKAANTANLEYAFKRVKEAGYTPMLYTYKPYLIANVNYDSFFDKHPNSLWIAAYASMNVTTTPNFAYFPSFRDIGAWQYTSMARPEGLDHNVDLLGVTYNGYTKNDNPKTKTPAIEEGKKADNTPKKDIDVGYTVKVNFGAKNWSVGGSIPSWVKGKPYTVAQVDSKNNRVLLGGIMSWIRRSDIEILQTKKQAISAASSNTYIVRSGDSWWSIANAHGISMYTLAALNDKSINNVIYPGQTLKLSGSTNTTATTRYYKVQSGDNLSYIANKLGVTTSYLKSKNNIQNVNLIYIGQLLAY